MPGRDGGGVAMTNDQCQMTKERGTASGLGYSLMGDR